MAGFDRGDHCRLAAFGSASRKELLCCEDTVEMCMFPVWHDSARLKQAKLGLWKNSIEALTAEAFLPLWLNLDLRRNKEESIKNPLNDKAGVFLYFLTVS